MTPDALTPPPPVFISFVSKDTKIATTICQAIEGSGAACWIFSRDVKAGENFAEAIIKAIQNAKIMVLVFSSNTNNSGEIKKELAIASQNGLVVIPVRVEDVLPSGAFAFELSTRQWTDLFQDGDMAMELLVKRIAAILRSPDLYIRPAERPAEPDLPRETASLRDSSKSFIFVSHVREDREEALSIVDVLEKRGLNCWIAPRDVHPGKPFDDEIANAIENCLAMLLIFSTNCNDRDYIRREITFAGDAKKLIIPFRIEDVRPQGALRLRLSDLHWIDAFVKREMAIEQLMKILTMPKR